MNSKAKVGSKTPKSKKQTLKKQTKKIPGTSKILVIAPHGVPEDDENADIIARELNKQSDALAVVNDICPKSQVDLGMSNDLTDRTRAIFVQKINSFKGGIVQEHGSALVVLIHGIDDSNMQNTADKRTHVLIGIGQANPNDPKKKDRLTLDYPSADHLIKCLGRHNLKARLAPGGTKYCGHDKRRLNQLFNDKNQKEFYDPNVRSVQLEIRRKGFRETPEEAKKTAELLTKAFTEYLATEPVQQDVAKTVSVRDPAPVKRVRISNIVVGQPDDGHFAFRVTSNDPDVKKRCEEEIQSLADSIQNNGLVHPLVLIKSGDGKYRILCGFRRFAALKLLGRKEVEARVYREKDLTDEQCMLISLAENKDRRDLSPIEIGHFLRCAKKRLGWPDSRLATEFGEALGIGKSHSSANKHLKLDEIRVKGESPEIVNDVLKRVLSFGVAAEELAFINKPEDRNALYEKVVKPLRPKKPELRDIKKLFGEMGNGFKSTLAKKNVRAAIKQAQESEDKGQELIKQLKLLVGDDLTKQKKEFEDRVATIRNSVFGKDATEEHFSVIPPPDMEKNELTVRFKVTDDGFDGTVDNIKKLLKGKSLRQLMDLVASP